MRRLLACAALALALPVVACGSSDEPISSPLFAGQPEVTFHDSQPMVVDIQVELSRAGTIQASVPEDPGVHGGSSGSTAGTSLDVRLRGLIPDTDYQARVVARDAQGASQTALVDFHTLGALPGFIAKFPVTTHGTPSPDLRIFDLAENPYITHGAIYAIAPDGRTRFYLPRPAKTQILTAVAAGIKLRDDGTLLFIEDNHALIVDELGQVKMDVSAKSLGLPAFHHDIVELPNGDFLTLSWVFKNVDYPSQGTLYVAGDLLVEFTPDGKKVWTWNAFDHLDPHKVSAEFANVLITDPATAKQGHDWTHANAIVYDSADDSILLSMRHQDWILKIDHKTGHVIWKLGPQGDFTLTKGKWFYHQHSPELEPDGSLLLYDNGVGNPDPSTTRSRPLQIAFDEKAMTATQVWDETNEKYLSLIAGDADRLENGDVNVLDSTMPLDPPNFLPSYARIREVDPKDNTWVWTARLPDNHFAFRCISTTRLPGEPAR